MSVAVELDRVDLGYPGVDVLSGLTLSVRSGEIMALLGPSGSGKTSLLRLILGFLPPRRGSVLLGGVPVSREGVILAPPEERNLAVVFQDLALWPHFTVHGNLAFGLESRGVPRDDRERRIAEMLARVGLRGKHGSYPSELSGGERQRVAIARALVLNPGAVLLDEPLANLDVGLKRELLVLFRELFRERGSTAIYVTHEPREAAALGERIAVLVGGRLIQLGTLAEISADPAQGFVRELLADLRWSGAPEAGSPPRGRG